MWSLPEFQSLDEVSEELVAEVLAPGGNPPPAVRTGRLLERMAKVVKPKASSHRILRVLSRLAGAEWLRGRLEVVLSDFGVATGVDVFVHHGKSRARFRSLSVPVPLAELATWAREHPRELAPLVPFGEPVPERLSLRARRAAGQDPPASSGSFQMRDAAPPSRGPTDIHKRSTMQIRVVVPPAALPSEPPAQDTVRPPQAQKGAPVAPKKEDDTDEGWE